MRLQPLFATIGVLCCTVISIHGQITDPYPPSPAPDRIVLSWSGDPATSQSVSWRTDVSISQSYVEIAPASADPSFVFEVRRERAITETMATNRNVANFHSVTIDSLTPNTLYAYRVSGQGFHSEWFQFKTAKAEAAPFSFLYFGDAQNEIKSLWSRCVRQAFMSKPDIDFMLHAGDLVNRANNDYEWGEWFYAGGWVFGTKAQIACPGNHEYSRNPDNEEERLLSSHWRPTFTFPENGPEGLEETVYYIDYQGARIITLNTMGIYADPRNLDKQTKWLIKVLKDNPNQWTIITHHHPIYSTSFGRDNEEIRAAFQPIYERFNVDIVLQGHDHSYGRGHNIEYGGRVQEDKGPMYVVSVSGPKMYELAFGDWLERTGASRQLYQIVRVDGNTLNYEAYTATGELYDAFDLIKGERGVNTYVNRSSEAVAESLKLPQRALRGMSEEEIQVYQQRLEAYKARTQNE